MILSYKYIFIILLSIAFINGISAKQGEQIEIDTVQINRFNQMSYENWISNPEKSKSYAYKALKLSDSINYDQGAAFAYRSLGVANWAQGNYEIGLNYLLKSKENYLKLNDAVNVANVNLNTGLIYNAQGNFEKALSLYHQALKAFTNSSKPNRQINTLNHMGESYQLQGEYDSANYYYNKALNISGKVSYSYGKASSLMFLGSLYKEQNQVDSALLYCLNALKIQNEIDDNYGKTNTLLNLGQISRLKNQSQSAIEYLSLGLKEAEKIKAKKLKSDILYELMETYKSLGEYKVSLEYFERYKIISDSLLNAELIRNISRLENKVQLERNASQLELLKKEARIDTILRYILLIGLVCTLAIGYLLYSRQRLKNIKSKELLKSQEELSRAEMENAQLKERELEQKIDHKNKELASYALNFQQKNELIAEIKSLVTDLKKLKIDQVSTKLAGLNKLVKNHSHVDKEWQDFKRYFEDVHNEFFTSLKNSFPDLTNNELKLCALLKLNLNMKETANILGISPDSVKTARYRLRKKLQLNTEQNLVDFIINFEKGID